MKEHIKDFVKETLLFSFEVPAIAKEKYFKLKQEESGYSVNEFFSMFIDLIKGLHEKLHENDWRRIKGVEIIHRLSLRDFTNGKLNIYINDADLYEVTEIIKSILSKEDLNAENTYQETLRKQKTNRQILQDAIKERNGKGLETVEVHELATRHGRSKKNLENNYRDWKEDLLKKK